MLFKQFAGIDAFPICLDTKDIDAIVETVVRIAPIFGGINLEDISAPRCFEVERRLSRAARYPGHARRSARHGRRDPGRVASTRRCRRQADEELPVVVAGSGAAGTATIKMLLAAGVRDVIPVDRVGALNRSDHYENSHWTWLAEHTNRENRRGSLADVLEGADVFIGVSAPGILRPADLTADGPRSDRLRDGQSDPGDHARRCRSVRRSDGDRTLRFSQPGQQSARFPRHLPRRARLPREPHHRRDETGGGARDRGIITDEERNPEYVVPSVFDPRVVDAVAKRVAAAAVEEGVARRQLLARRRRGSAGSGITTG